MPPLKSVVKALSTFEAGALSINSVFHLWCFKIFPIFTTCVVLKTAEDSAAKLPCIDLHWSESKKTSLNCSEFVL